MLPSNQRHAADKNGQGLHEKSMFSREEGFAGSTVRALPTEKKEREATLLGLGVADRLAYDMKLENERAKARESPVAQAETRDPQDDETTPFDRLADTCEVSLIEMEVVRPQGENVASALGTYPELAVAHATGTERPEWLKGDRSFTAAIVATALCTMLALVLITTSRGPEPKPGEDLQKPATSAPVFASNKGEAPPAQELGGDAENVSAQANALSSAPTKPTSHDTTVQPNSGKKRVSKVTKRRRVRISKTYVGAKP